MPLRSDIVRVIEILTSEEWDCVELLPPVVGDLDAAVVYLAVADPIPLAVGIGDQLRYVVWIQRVHYVEIVCAVRHAALGELVW